MEKEHGQVTGIIWRGPEDLAVYQLVKQYAEKQSLTVSAAAKELVKIGLKDIMTK
ncbi:MULTISPECIES: hypothetical protein [Limosilactobacillus]|jgi:hypothetical protein|uniref:CopG family transcriptional regulator n=1 Tax=Limosilactobacillus portuensis TaxID=2742601 RepID=A0ABS6IWJ5_9LACO|nr:MULTISPECIES: hypothetical protein [Limosilactobacillus]MCR5524780.1 hypothetical protein [Lactobacillus sp.]MDU1505915.1 hypothetical protein [Limosilactobacillus vaginalis]MBD8087759.1 hypothetical protein [Limosilactobacillus portuensis]MBU9695673.1 hypothetical protein [Limosilactobacillus portuensis]MEC4742182.1 hypothetical protein [Limosilactobacillus sp. c10Ua_36]